MEASPNHGKALSAVNRLREAMPGAGHPGIRQTWSASWLLERLLTFFQAVLS